MPLNHSLQQKDCYKSFGKLYGDYDSLSFYEGSGGGSYQNSKSGGSGGGIIFI